MHATKLALSVLLVTAAAALAWQPGRDRDRPPPATPPTPPAIDPGRTLSREVAPYEYHLHAYRLDHGREPLIVLVARGANRTGGYRTSLEWAGEPGGEAPEVRLSNTPPGPGIMAAQAITPFDATVFFRCERGADKVTVTVAGRAEEVEVRPIKELKPSPDAKAPREPGR